MLLFSLIACGDPVVVADYLAVINMAPSNGAVEVSSTTNLVATFNDNVSGSDVSGASLVAADLSVVALETSFSEDGHSIVAQPVEPLLEATEYTFQLSTGIQGASFGALAAPVAATFTTRGAPIEGGNTAPTAAIADTSPCILGTPLVLDGATSSDPEGDVLTFSWRLVGAPEGSVGVITDPALATTDFVADVPGIYVFGLLVSDGLLTSSEAFWDIPCNEPPPETTDTAG